MRIYFSFIECPLGTLGINCSSECPEGYFGKLCQEECDCTTDYYCDRRFGCRECPPGSFGLNCSGTCLKKYYGQFCQEECNCTSSQYCDPQRGCLKCVCTSNHYCDPTYGCLPKNKGRYNTCTPYMRKWRSFGLCLHMKEVEIKLSSQKSIDKLVFSDIASMFNNIFQFVLFIAKHQSI